MVVYIIKYIHMMNNDDKINIIIRLNYYNIKIIIYLTKYIY
jgi:hypothetical protein